MYTTSLPSLPAGRAGLRPSALPADANSRPRRLLVVVWEALKAVGASRGRRELLALARDQEAIRPELAASLRSAARRSWL